MKLKTEELSKYVKLPKGQFRLEPPLKKIYEEDSKILVIMKGSQAHITTFAFITELIYARYYPSPVTIIHAFPTNEMAKEQAERLAQLISINSTWLGRASGSKLYKRIVNYKTHLHSSIIISGVSTERDVIATDADFIVTDEFDRAINPQLTAELESRTLASSLAKKMIISVPYAGQGAGISQRFRESTQNYWFVKCRSCHKEVPLMDKFWETDEYPPYFRCPECHKPLDPNDPEAVEVRRKGKYKPLNPKSLIVGYHISRLLYPSTKLIQLVQEYPTASEDFWYTWIGGFPSKIDLPINTHAEIVPSPNLANFPIYIGLDVGLDFYIVAVGVYADKFIIDKVYKIKDTELKEELAQLISKYQVVGIMCDQAPEHHRSLNILSSFNVPFAFIKYGQYYFVGGEWFTCQKDTYLVEKWEIIRRFLIEMKERKIAFTTQSMQAVKQAEALRPMKIQSGFTWQEPSKNDELHSAIYCWFASKIFQPSEIESSSSAFQISTIEIAF